jgi:hypothetical protein
MAKKTIVKKLALSQDNLRIIDLENKLYEANLSIFNLQNDIIKITSTKGYRFIEKLRLFRNYLSKIF